MLLYSIPVVDKESTFDFDVSFQFTVDGPQKYLLGKRLGDDKGNFAIFSIEKKKK